MITGVHQIIFTAPRPDPAEVPLELAELAHGIVGQPAWDGRSLAQEVYERRAADRRERRKVPEWFQRTTVGECRSQTGFTALVIATSTGM